MNTPDTPWDEVFQMMSWWDSDKVTNARVLVVGAGALGNEVLKNLVLLNVGEIFVIDFDRIEYSNLSRSVLFRERDLSRIKAEVVAERCRDINPNVRIEWMNGDVIYDLGLGFIRSVNVIIGCLDNRIARLFVNRYAYRFGKTWINAGIVNLAGMLDVFKPGVSCYECGLKTKDWDQIRKRLGCPDIAKRNQNYGRLPTTPISSSIIAAMQVQEAFKVIYGNDDELLADRRYYYDGQANESIYYPSLPLKPDCESHVRWEEIIEEETLTNQISVGKLLDYLEKRFTGKSVSVLLEYEIVTELYSEATDTSHPILMPKFRITDTVHANFQSEPGEALRIPPDTTFDRLDRSFPQPELSLQEVGIPPWHILELEVGDDILHLELSGDRGYYFPAETVQEAGLLNDELK